MEYKYISYVQSTSRNSGIDFDFNNLQVKVWNNDRRIMFTNKYYSFKNDDNDQTLQYFQNIAKILELFNKYNYPFDIKFKNLENPTSELIFLYEGQEVELKDIEKLYDNLKEKEKQVEEEVKELEEKLETLEFIAERRKIRKSLYYSGNYKASQEEYLVDGCRVRLNRGKRKE